MRFTDDNRTTRFSLTQGNEGYWGRVTASVDFCEFNYTATPYVAEFANALSNLFLVAAGAYNLWVSRGLERLSTLYLMAEPLARTRFPHLPLFLILIAVAYSYAHARLRLVVPFYIVFAASLLVPAAMAVKLARPDGRVPRQLGITFAIFVVSISAWELCDSVEFLKLHAWWHLGMALVAIHLFATLAYV
ncbi:alkaline ceramidase ydc1 [Blastocladiella emersonii ATCC 22665]|nr:alkaline ceramidase ydc1 [Blastocladiella emersonii ATCC 22665]